MISRGWAKSLAHPLFFYNFARLIRPGRDVMNKTILFAVSALLICSCSARQEMECRLDNIEEYISEAPQRALDSLRTVAVGDIPGKENRARAALLHSMALDKCYIDVTSDSIIVPAIDWYSLHGSPDEKLKTFYYLGRIHENAGDDEAAMRSFVKAEEYAGYAKDHTAIGKVYFAKSRIYYSIFDTDLSMENMKKAMVNFLKGNDIENYTQALLDISVNCIASSEPDSAMAYLNQAKRYLSQISNTRRDLYHSTLMELKSETVPDSSLFYIDLYRNSLQDKNDTDWYSLSRAFLSSGHPDSALVAISKYTEYAGNPENDILYQIAISEIYDSLGLDKESKEAYRRYVDLSDSVDIAVFNSRARYTEEKHADEIQILKIKNHRKMLWLGIIACIGISASIIQSLFSMIKKHTAEKKRLEELISNISKERDLLKQISSGWSDMDNNASSFIESRLGSLENFFASRIAAGNAGDMRSAIKELEDLMADRDKFVYSTGISYSIRYPEFVRFLQAHGLTPWEIGYCCLYIMGLKGKEIGSFIQKAGYNNINSAIRRKLGIEKYGTRLDKFLLERFNGLKP